MNENILIFHCYGKPYVDFAKFCSYSIRLANINDPLLFYCDPKYVDELRDFERRWKLDFEVKPLNIPHFKKFYGGGYRFFYDSEYWAGKNVFIGDVDTFYLPNEKFLENYFSHCKTTRIPVSCLVREIDHFNNSSFRHLIETFYYLGFKHAIKCIPIGTVPVYRVALTSCLMLSEFTSRPEFVEVSKKYLSFIDNSKFFKNHPRGINNECLVYDFLSELGVFLPIHHHKTNFTARILEDHDGKSIYYRPHLGLHLCSCRPREWNSGQGLFNANKFLDIKNGKEVLSRFLSVLETPDGEKLLDEVSETFSNMIIETKNIIKKAI